MKVCFFGLGSIGKRHLKNLTNICKNKKIDIEVHAFRNTNNKLDEEIKSLVDKEIFIKDDLSSDYDIVFINNPTSMHYKTIEFMKNKCKNMFIEKPIFDDIVYDLKKLDLNKGFYYVACPLRYSNIVEYLKENIDIDKVYSVRAICSSYLPNWRKNTDYRKTYSAIKSQGGGVSIDLIHEWDYLTYIFGIPNNVFNFQGKFSNLEIDSEDLSVYIAKYKDKLIELHLDYFGRTSKREVEIYIDLGCIKGDFIKNKVTFDYDKEDVIFYNEDNNYMYEKEMEYFLDCVINKKYKNSNINNAYNVLKFIKESE